MFFSIKNTLKINGKVYLPCVCYPLTKGLEKTISKLVDEGKAKLYKEKVFFQSGKELKSFSERELEIKEQKKAERKAKKEALLKTSDEPKVSTSLTDIEGF